MQSTPPAASSQWQTSPRWLSTAPDRPRTTSICGRRWAEGEPRAVISVVAPPEPNWAAGLIAIVMGQLVEASGPRKFFGRSSVLGPSRDQGPYPAKAKRVIPAACAAISVGARTPLVYPLGELQQGPGPGLDSELRAHLGPCRRSWPSEPLTGAPLLPRRQPQRPLRDPDGARGPAHRHRAANLHPGRGGPRIQAWSPGRPDRLGGRRARRLSCRHDPPVMPLFFFNTHRDLVFISPHVAPGAANALTCPTFYSVLPDLSNKAALRASVAVPGTPQCQPRLLHDGHGRRRLSTGS